MKKYTLLLLPILLGLACSQATSQASPKPPDKQQKEQEALYLKESLALIKQIEGKALTTTFILLDKPASLESEYCLKAVLADATTYSEAELKAIKNYTQPALSSWAGVVPGVKIINNDNVTYIFKNRNKSWDYFYRTIGPGFNEFSAPIFLRKYTYCLLYSANYCGGLCAGGSLRLYKKQKGVWQVVKSYCDWVS